MNDTQDEKPSAAPPPEATDELVPEGSAHGVADEAPSFPIVGVGASAGGLEAFTRFLKTLPADTGMAFVLVQHLAPTHPSALAGILARATSMPVLEVEDDRAVAPNQVYVIPPGRNMVISRGTLQLQPREASGQQRPIDRFFRALADDRKHGAIGVVLSGTATDGTLGLQAIKAEGGITFAQDQTAQHDGMPQSAIASGCVDFVLPPEEIAQEISRIGRHPYSIAPARISPKAESEPSFTAILRLLRHATGADLSGYKSTTLHRRVNRRMLLQKSDGLPQYLAFLHENPAELEALYQDLLISVTRFFRDPECFDALKSSVFPKLLAGRSRHEPLRVWTLGCSTGEEAYSVAMAFTEFSDASSGQAPLQLFATDLNGLAIDRARTGLYPKDIALDVSPERLKLFFLEIDGRYRIGKAIRESCVFARHDALHDPPFSRIDLISCRNLLIYLEPEQQQQIMRVLHFALQPTGFLWLGGSETVGSSRNLFEVVDARHKIYAKRPGPSPRGGRPPSPDGRTLREIPPMVAPRSRDVGGDSQREAERVLLTRFAPPGVLVSTDLDILQFRGDTGPYLSPSPGKASLNLLKMLREGLLVAVRSAILRSREQEAPVREEGLRIGGDAGGREVAVEVIPLKGYGTKDGGFWVLFEGGGRDESRRETPAEPDAATSDQHRLVKELTETREYLQSVIEQQEAANEELQSANEEVQSANEELQSVNEELETSKEEIQSTNEELATVNDELKASNADLARVNSDLVNLLGSAQIPIVILGRDLRVRRFTAAAEKLLELTPSDVGRPLAELDLGLDGVPDLASLLAEVVDTVSPREREVQDEHRRWYSLRLRPYKTLENRIDGVVAVLVDVDALKRAEAFTEGIVATLRDPILVLDSRLAVRTASRAFYETFQVTPEETEGRLLYDLGDRQWDAPELRRLMERILPQEGRVQNFEVEREFPRIGKRTMRLDALRLVYPGDEPWILLSVEDVTKRKELADELRRNADALTEADRRKNEFLSMLAHELRNPLAPIRSALQILQLTSGESEVQCRALEMMERQVDQMVHLVDDLLDVSRVSRGTIALRRERVELASTVSHAADATRAACERSKQELVVTLPPEPIYLNADPTRLAQVVGNLLNNASKFTREGGHIRVMLERRGAEAILTVRDDGIGIAPDQVPRIFDLFTQVDTSLARSAGGLGIGLALVRTLVEMHDGTVEVTSAGLGTGSEFVVRLPITADVPGPATEPPVEEKARAATRILVVDDNRDAADSLATLLQLVGNVTHTAYEGDQALEAAPAFRPDVVILDIGLPGMSGYEVARAIRSQPWGKTMVLVALTGWGQPEDMLHTAEAGFDHHIVKPVELKALMRIVAEPRRSGEGPTPTLRSES